MLFQSKILVYQVYQRVLRRNQRCSSKVKGGFCSAGVQRWGAVLADVCVLKVGIEGPAPPIRGRLKQEKWFYSNNETRKKL